MYFKIDKILNMCIVYVYVCFYIMQVFLVNLLVFISKFLMWMFGLYRNVGVNDVKVERVKIVEDFVQRKKEVVLNKYRGQVDIFGVSGYILVQYVQNCNFIKGQILNYKVGQFKRIVLY